MTTKTYGVLFLFTAVTFCLGGCGVRRSTQIARQAVEQFHTQLDKGDVASLAASADAKFKAAARGNDFATLLDGIHRKLGPVRSAVEQKCDYNFNNGITDVTLVYKTRFAGGDATETFTYQIDGEKPILRDYNFDSPELPSKK